MTYRLSSTAHLLTIDVMDWHRDPIVARAIPEASRAALDGRAGQTVDALLDHLGGAGACATFFVTRSVVQRDRSMARRIVAAGHELGARGEFHGLDWDGFRFDARVAKASLEDAGGVQVRGFRSPYAGGREPSGWRFECLVEEAYEYDSSRVARAASERTAAVPSYPQTIVCDSGSLIEVPLLPHPFGGAALSVRRAPYPFVRHVYASRARAGLPGVMSFAAWEIDDEQPRQPLSMLASFRHYGGRRVAKDRVGRLLREFRFDAIGHRLAELAQDAPSTYAA